MGLAAVVARSPEYDRQPLRENADPADLAMDRYADGESAAFSELYDLVAPRLYTYLKRQTRSGPLAEDLLQQTFLQIHHARGSFVRGAKVMPWAFAIARRLAIDVARRGRFEADVPVEELVTAVAPEAESLVDARRLSEALQAAFRALPENQRVAYELTKIEGLTLAETAEILGTTVMATKLRVFRAAETLRAVADAHSGDTAR